MSLFFFFFFSSRRRHTRSTRDWSSDVCSSDLKSGFHVGLPTGFRICRPEAHHSMGEASVHAKMLGRDAGPRSEERRVGKECRSGGGRYEQKKKVNRIREYAK